MAVKNKQYREKYLRSKFIALNILIHKEKLKKNAYFRRSNNQILFIDSTKATLSHPESGTSVRGAGDEVFCARRTTPSVLRCTPATENEKKRCCHSEIAPQKFVVKCGNDIENKE